MIVVSPANISLINSLNALIAEYKWRGTLFRHWGNYIVLCIIRCVSNTLRSMCEYATSNGPIAPFALLTYSLQSIFWVIYHIDAVSRAELDAWIRTLHFCSFVLRGSRVMRGLHGPWSTVGKTPHSLIQMHACFLLIVYQRQQSQRLLTGFM